MSKCTAAQAVQASEYWDGYKEKASRQYAETRDKSAFDKNAGSNNYTFFGYNFGLQGQPYCAMAVTQFVLDACGGVASDTKTVLHGVYPYTCCDQLCKAAPAGYKGKRGSWVPKIGDIVIFDYPNNSYEHDHTGMVVEVSVGCTATAGTIKVREGNSGDMVKVNTYSVSNTNIKEYIRPKYADAAMGSPSSSGTAAAKKRFACTPTVDIVQDTSECGAGACKSLQVLLNAKFGAELEPDGEFGPLTKAALTDAQKKMGVEQDGSCGKDTWTALLGY